MLKKSMIKVDGFKFSCPFAKYANSTVPRYESMLLSAFHFINNAS